MTSGRIAFLGMELTAEEAVELLSHALAMACMACALPDDTVGLLKVRAEAFQSKVFAMHTDPARRHVRCATCGQTRQDTAVVPDDTPGYRVARTTEDEAS